METRTVNPRCRCLACGTEMPDATWHMHVNTKQHIDHYKRAQKLGYFYDKAIYDSHFGTYCPLLFTFLPKVKWNPKTEAKWRTYENKK